LAQFDVSITVSQNPLELNFTISNPLTQSQTFLQWGTPIEGVWTDMFDIRDEQNNRLDYIGKIVMRGDVPIQEEYVTIPAGGSISAMVNLGDNYEFLSVGKYIISVDLPAYCKLQYSTTDVQVFHLETIPPRKPIGAPGGFTGCSAAQISYANAAITGARSQSARAFTCLNQGCDALYNRWFGTYNLNNWNFVSIGYRNINNRLTNYAFNGYCDSGCASNVFAYVYPTDGTLTVYLCALFFNRSGDRNRVIVHEMSHFRTLCGTQDYTYGTASCLSLARSNPSQASHNADNVCYFATEA
jgi:hypothetical protein